MTDVALSDQHLKFCDFPKIHLDDIDERCGEVFITISGTLIFHCSLCASIYGGVDNFLDHLASQHYKDIQENKEEIENDVKSCRSDSETLLKDYNTVKLCHEQKFDVTDVDIDYDGGVKEDYNDCVDNGDDIDDDDDGVDDVDVNLEDDDVNDDDIDEYEEMLQSKEAENLDRTNYEHIAAESKKSDTEKDETGIKDEILDITETNSTTKPKKQYRKKVTEPFKCGTCGKEFGRKVFLKRHYLIHSDERKFKCKICTFAFKDRSNLDSHVRRIHLGTNKIECGYCPKTFFSQTEVTSHRRVHTGERPFACSICDKAYTTSNRLRIHNKRHTSEPTFRCGYCEKGFYERFRYEDHILSHTKEKQFVCEICAATFPRHKSWLRHSKLHEKQSD